MHDPREHGTFSIVACDPERTFWGVAVTTMPPSVGAVVPWARWRTGAIATQAYSNYQYGPAGLALLDRGLAAEDVVRRLTRSDSGRESRQLGIVDRRGNAAAWTGKKCLSHALHVTGEGFSCQGNILASDEVIHAMARAFETSRGSLGARMMGALRAGLAHGGDRRGHQSAAMLVAHRERWMKPIWSDHWVDLRVDRSKRPVQELARLLAADERETRRFLAQRERERRARRARRG